MPLDFNEIVSSRLWVGCFVRPDEIGLLAGLRVTTVINLQSEEDLVIYDIHMGDLLCAYEPAGIQLRRVPIQDFDNESLSANLPAAVAEIEGALRGAGSRVYLHCTAGINRSPTAAAAYLMGSAGLSAEVAINHVMARRRCSPSKYALERYADTLAARNCLNGNIKDDQ